MTDPYSIYNTVVDLMCVHCNARVFEKCKSQHEDARCKTMIKCMGEILKREDEMYPVKLPKGE